VVEENGDRSNLFGACRTTNNNEGFEGLHVSKILLAVSNPPIGGDVEAVTIELEEYKLKSIRN
jgi:hypothetical protein